MLAHAELALKTALAHWDGVKDWKYAIFNESLTVNAGTSTFPVVTTYKKTYDVRMLLPTPRHLQYIPQREYNALRPDQVAPGLPWGYHTVQVWDDGGGQNGSPGSITLVPVPDAQVTLIHTYHVRHDWDGTNLKIPLRFQWDLIALAKMYFLADRGNEENLSFWTSVAMQGLERAKAEDEWSPDANAGFVPGTHAFRQGYSPNDVIPFLGEW